jgi:hypothetical protein
VSIASEEIAHLHHGLHLAMEALIRQRDYDEAERVLRIVDVELARVLDQLRYIEGKARRHPLRIAQP